MLTIKEKTWTIREASEVFFSGKHNRLPVNTIQTWMKRRIFNPFLPVKRRDPRGSGLSLSDIVTLSLFNVLFKVGVKFESVCFPTKDLIDQALDLVSGKIKVETLRNEVRFSKAGLSQQQAAALRREIQLHRRPIQTYLESVEYQALIFVLVVPGPRTTHSLIFRRITSDILEEGAWMWIPKEPFGLPIPRMVIDVREHFVELDYQDKLAEYEMNQWGQELLAIEKSLASLSTRQAKPSLSLKQRSKILEEVGELGHRIKRLKSSLSASQTNRASREAGISADAKQAALEILKGKLPDDELAQITETELAESVERVLAGRSFDEVSNLVMNYRMEQIRQLLQEVRDG